MKISRAWIAGCATLWLAAPSIAEDVAGSGTVARATFTSGIDDREPVDEFAALSNDNVQAIFFTELLDMNGQTVIHRWELDGKVMAEVPFAVAGDRWRVWSSKNLEPSWLGQWTVSVVDEAGAVLRSENLLYAESAETPAPTPTTPVEAPVEDAPAAAAP